MQLFYYRLKMLWILYIYRTCYVWISTRATNGWLFLMWAFWRHPLCLSHFRESNRTSWDVDAFKFDLTRPHLLVRCHSQQTVLQHLQVRKACRECWCRQMCKLYISPLPYPRVVWYILLRIKRYICYCSAYHVSFCSVRFGARSSPQDMVFANVEISKWPLSRSKNLPSGTKPLTRLSNGHIKKRNPLLAAFHIQPKLLVLCGQILQKAEFLKELKPSEAHLVALPHVHVQTVAIIGWPISMISAPECKRLSCGHKLTVTLRILTSLTVRSPTILPPTMFLPRGWIVKACVAQVTPTVGR